MRIVSILENQNIEKRIAITPEIAKKYISLGLEVSLPENYGSHLGIKDDEYKELGVSILKDEKEILTGADIIVQLGVMVQAVSPRTSSGGDVPGIVKTGWRSVG